MEQIKLKILVVILSFIAVGYAQGQVTSGNTTGSWSVCAGTSNNCVTIDSTGRLSVTGSGQVISTSSSGNAATATALAATPAQCTSGQYSTGIAAAGTANCSQPTFAQIGSTPTTISGYGITDGVTTARTVSTTAPLAGGGALSGNLSLTCTGCLTGNQTVTLSGDVSGSGATAITTALGNIPTAVTAAGTIVFGNIAAPGSPASAHVSIWADSTDLRFHDKNASGVIGTTVVADTGASNNFLTAISAAGAISKAQPSCSSLSNAGTACTAVAPADTASTANNFFTAYTASTGAFTKAQPTCGNLSNSGSFCSGTDAANLTGTVAAARLNPSTAAHLFLGNNTGSTAAASFLQLACADLSDASATCATAGVPTGRTVSTSSPLGGGGALSGNLTLTCTTCATTTNGGALSATSPVTISAAGVIACSTCAVTGTTISTTSPLGGGGDISANRTFTCTTCATTTNGGALSGTSPVTVSAAGAIGCATCLTTASGQVLNAPTIGISGTTSSSHILSVGTAPTCAFSTGGGSSPSCALDTGSTDSFGTMTITTGSGSPGSTGTITLTFNASYGTNNTVCVGTLASGATAWSVSSTVFVTTLSKTAPVFTWNSQSATAAVALTASTNYKINYICGGR